MNLKTVFNKKVLVVGDVILDSWQYANAVGLSLESPTLKAQFTRKEQTFGGTANVVANLKSLGAQISFITLLGDDEFTKYYDPLYDDIDNFLPVFEDDRTNTVKERFWIQRGNQTYKHLQVNRADNRRMNRKSSLAFVSNVKAILDDVEIVMLIDYRHGIFKQPKLLKDLMPILKESKKQIICSSQISDWGNGIEPFHKNFHGADLIVMNSTEIERNLRPNEAPSDLTQRFQSNICVTKGKEGSWLYMLDGSDFYSKAMKVEEVDSCGAGDSFISCLAVTNWSVFQESSLHISNYWASLCVQQQGTGVPSKEEAKNLRSLYAK